MRARAGTGRLGQLAASFAASLLLLRCSSIPDYERASDPPPPSEAGLDDAGRLEPPDASDPTPDAADAGCTVAFAQPSPAQCGLAIPLARAAGAVRFGALQAPQFSVGTGSIYVVRAGALWRFPRASWSVRGADGLDDCHATRVGAVDGTVLDVLRFGNDGVCVRSRTAAGTEQVGCAASWQDPLQPLPAVDGGDPDAYGGFSSADGALVWWQSRDGTDRFYSYLPGAAEPYSPGISDYSPGYLAAPTRSDGAVLYPAARAPAKPRPLRGGLHPSSAAPQHPCPPAPSSATCFASGSPSCWLASTTCTSSASTAT